MPVKEPVLRRKELLKLLCKPRPIQTSAHRLRGDSVVKQDFRHIDKLPTVFQCTQPEIPIFRSLDGHRAVVAVILFPNGTAVEGGAMNVIRMQQPIRVKRADMPTARTDPEAFRIPVDDTNLRIRVQDSNSAVYPAGSQVIISIQRKKIFSLRSEDANVPRRGYAFVLLPDDLNSLCHQFVHFPDCPLACGTVINDNQHDNRHARSWSHWRRPPAKIRHKAVPNLCPPYIARGSGAFASNNHVLRASLRAVDIVA